MVKSLKTSTSTKVAAPSEAAVPLVGHFRFSTEILRRLGEELNPSPEKGVMELVKNAYDADAKSCTIKIEDLGKKGTRIVITDNGDGMTLEDIHEKLLVLGRSTKSKAAPTRLGRVPTGSKGLGRLAALRMGDSATIATCRRQSNETLSLTIEWDKFDHAAIVEDVEFKIATKPGGKQGTQLTIVGRDLRIKRMDVKRLARELLLLAGPFPGTANTFRPTLDAPEFKDLADLVETSYFREADYHLSAVLLPDGTTRATVTDWRQRPLYAGNHADIASRRKGNKPYLAPAASFEFWAFVLNDESFQTRNVTIAEVREWIRHFGGVHLYENEVRVDPYGNPGHDWLELNLRRAQGPEERPSTNNSIGRVSISDTTGVLVQKTDRSGFIETDAFDELKSFARDCLEWMHRCRLSDAEKRRRAARGQESESKLRSKARLEKTISTLPKARREEVARALEAYEKGHDREVSTLRKEVQLYRTLSTAGITAATFAHESTGNPLKIITGSCASIETRARRIDEEAFEKHLKAPLVRINEAARSLGVLGTSTLRLVEHEKRRFGSVNVNDVVRGIAETFEPFIVGRRVNLHLTLSSSKLAIRGTEAALESIVTNLLNNALVALETNPTDRRNITITTVDFESRIELSVADDGPGISDISEADIWLPGQTTKRNGTGLGLTIVRDAVADLGGEAVLSSTGKAGTTFTIKIPTPGSGGAK